MPQKAAFEVAKRETEISKLDSEIASKEEAIASLETEIEDLNNQIELLQGEIIKIKGEPISFPAGYFTAGTDFQTGRNKIYNGHRNFVVYSASGRLRVNIILGSVDDDFSVKEYVYNFETGDQIESRTSFKMVFIE